MVLGRVTSLVLLVMLVLAADARARPLQRWEHGGAQLQLNRVRLLTERLSRLNVQQQMRLGGATRAELVATATKIDTAVRGLGEGSPRMGVPAPPTLEIRKRIEALDSAWGALRSTAVASPYEYVRRATERGAADPFGIRYFESLAGQVYARAAGVSEAYIALCEQRPGQNCRGVAQATASGMLSERLMKELVLVIAGVDVAENRERLGRSREGLDRTLAAVAAQEPVQATVSPERGKAGVVAAGIWGDVQATWKELRVDVDRVIAGEGEQVALTEALARQHDFLRDLQRLSVAVRRFAAARRAAGGGPDA